MLGMYAAPTAVHVSSPAGIALTGSLNTSSLLSTGIYSGAALDESGYAWLSSEYAATASPSCLASHPTPLDYCPNWYEQMAMAAGTGKVRAQVDQGLPV